MSQATMERKLAEPAQTVAPFSITSALNGAVDHAAVDLPGLPRRVGDAPGGGEAAPERHAHEARPVGDPGGEEVARAPAAEGKRHRKLRGGVRVKGGAAREYGYRRAFAWCSIYARSTSFMRAW